MTGKFDQPLGVPNSKRPAARKWRYPIYAVMIMFIGALGFSIMQSMKPVPSNAPKRDQNNAQPETSGHEKPQSSSIAKEGAVETVSKSFPDRTMSDFQEMDVMEDMEISSTIPGIRPKTVPAKKTLAHLPDMELIEKTATGPLPIKSPDGLRPLDVYSRRPDTEGNFGVARIVIIVGGLGISQTSTERAIRLLPPGVTLAFAPYGNSLLRWMWAARKAGHELLLQIPMEPFDYPRISAGKHSLLTSLNQQKNRANLHWALGRITNYVGIMNYLGGKMLTSPSSLLPIFEELTHRGLMFVDDGSIRNSMAAELSRSASLPFAKADIKIDAIRSRAQIDRRLKELAEKARRTGLAIGVATAFPESISRISLFLKDAKSRGLELTPVSTIAIEPKG